MLICESRIHAEADSADDKIGESVFDVTQSSQDTETNRQTAFAFFALGSRDAADNLDFLLPPIPTDLKLVSTDTRAQQGEVYSTNSPTGQVASTNRKSGKHDRKKEAAR